jgi:glycosyltransferase involved in cell wall biosynthesis
VHSLKTLLLNYTELRGGAARAANRLHRGLRAIGVDSQMLVQIRDTDDFTVLGPRGNLERFFGIVRPAIDMLPLLAYPRRTKATYYPGWLPSAIRGRVNGLTVDLAHLHWVAGGYMTPAAIKGLRVPLVWTLHDMWAFTGGCHYDDGCNKHATRCGACPVLGSASRYDLSLWGWRRKRSSFSGLPFTIITPSRWLGEVASRSSILGGSRVRVIPNGIDTSLYRPLERMHARDLLGLPKDRPIILFGALNPTGDARKGYRYLHAALEQTSATWSGQAPLAVVMGAEKPKVPLGLTMEVRYFGALSDDISLVLMYSSANVLVAPSTQENLSNMVMEALACGTPCVAFDVGGMPDMIEHRRNGYLAAPFDTQDLAAGIVWVLEDKERWKTLSATARRKVETCFELSSVAKSHVGVYQEAIESTAAVHLGSKRV